MTALRDLKSRDASEILKGQGLLNKFLARKEDLKDGGMPPAKAREKALAEIEPLLDRCNATLAEAQDFAEKFVGPPMPVPGEYYASHLVPSGAKDPLYIPPELATIRLDLFEDKKPANERDEIRYVFQHMRVSLEDLHQEDAPSPGAWGLLVEIRNDSASRREFMKSVWPRLIPTRGTQDDLDRMVDDGRQVTATIERLLGLKEAVERRTEKEAADG